MEIGNLAGFEGSIGKEEVIAVIMKCKWYDGFNLGYGKSEME